MRPATIHATPRRLVHARDLVANLVSRDFRARYKDSALGVLWAIASPLAQLFIYTFIFQYVLNLGIRRYSSFAFIGLVAWAWFSSTLNESVRVLKTSRYIIEQPGFPAAILPVVSVATNMVDFMIGLPLLLLIIASEGSPIHATLLAVPLVMGVQFAFTLGLAFIFAALNAALRDTQHLIMVGLQLYMFVTPIFYSLDSVPAKYVPLFELNPMLHIIEAYRGLVMTGQMPPWEPLLYVAAVAVLLNAVGLRVYGWARYRYLEEM